MRKRTMEELGRLSPPEAICRAQLPIVLILDNIRSMANVGSIFRTADALCIEQICLCGITATPPHREIYKTALGAEDSVQWKYFSTTTDAITYAKKEGYRVIGIEQTTASVDLKKYLVYKGIKYALVFGNEVAGISDDILPLLEEAIEIPQFGAKHSLNVSVSVAIVLWDFYSKL